MNEQSNVKHIHLWRGTVATTTLPTTAGTSAALPAATVSAALPSTVAVTTGRSIDQLHQQRKYKRKARFLFTIRHCSICSWFYVFASKSPHRKIFWMKFDQQSKYSVKYILILSEWKIVRNSTRWQRNYAVYSNFFVSFLKNRLP